MFKTIVVPVDLAHKERLEKALTVAAELARSHESELHLVGVTTEEPSSVAHTPEEYEGKLSAYAAVQSAAHGVHFIPHSIAAHDVRIDLKRHMLKEAETLGADLIVMASHVPGFADYLFGSNAGKLASHAKISVFVVR